VAPGRIPCLMTSAGAGYAAAVGVINSIMPREDTPEQARTNYQVSNTKGKIVMRLSGTALRRVLLAFALAGTAALGVTVASAASAAPAGQRYPACLTSHLRVWMGIPGEGSAGHVTYQLELSNISATTCSLHGYPGVSGITASGAQLGSPALWVPPPGSTVILTPGATAHVVLQIADVGAYSPSACKQTRAAGLRVYPPNQRTAAIMPFSFEACAKAGPRYLAVTPVKAGAGIPFYSR
jgi:hypothetical protein